MALSCYGCDQYVGSVRHVMTVLQEKQGYLRELEELIPQMETLIQDKDTLDQQVSFRHLPCTSALLA